MALEGSLAVDVDAGIRFEFVVTNRDDEPAELQFRTGQAAEFVVTDDDGEVWRWSDGRVFTQALRRETLGPGDSVMHEAAWPDPPPGAYHAVATLAAEHADVEARARFEV
jgi:hypothetical protein